MDRRDSEPMIQAEPLLTATSGTTSNTQTDELLSELIGAYSRDLFNLAYSYVRDYSLAEDLTQDAFLKAYRNFHQFHGKSSYKTWLYSITANCCKDYLRAKQIRQLFLIKKSLEPFEAADSAERAALEKLESNRLWNIVMLLPLKYREVIILHYKEDLPLAQIAEILGIAEPTVRTRLFRARDQLKPLLEKEGSTWNFGKNS